MATRDVIEREVCEAMQSGMYSVANLSMFDQISEIDVSDKVLLHLDYTNDMLDEYLNEIMELVDKKPGLIEYLKAIKEADVVDNHGLEKENSFLIGLYSQMPKQTAMERLIRYAKSGKNITDKNLLAIHHTLLYGTLSEDDDTVRKCNNKFVGRMVNGERIIDYFPIDYKEIPEATSKLVELYNQRLSLPGFDNVFFQPFLLHGLIGALQLFDDGNTRLGRVVQHALIWQLINERTDYDFELPPLYATRTYYPLRGKYRELIANLVKMNDSYAWNKWFDFNLDRIEDSIYASNENIKLLKRKIEFSKR